MIIFPAIDIRDGKCVRLYQGKFSASQVVGEDPVTTAMGFKKKGAEFLHVVDLDGALNGNMGNMNVISKVIREVGIPVQLGGGIRSLDFMEKLFDKGLSRAILGTAALNDPELVKEAVRKFGERIAVGIDAVDGYVAVEGWVKVSRTDYLDFADMMESIGVKIIIFTDIKRDGTLNGPNLGSLDLLNRHVSCDIIASGGIKDIEDIKVLKKMGIYGAIVGKAIYSGSIHLSEAIYEGRDDGDADKENNSLPGC